MDKYTALFFLVLCSVSVAIVTQLSHLPADRFGFVLGLLVFGVNIYLMVLLGKKLFDSYQKTSQDLERAGQNSDKKAKKGLWAAPGLFLLKFMLIGVGAYIALVVLNTSAMYFVGGALISLACYTGAAYLRVLLEKKWLK